MNGRTNTETANWRTSSYSGGGNQCVEVAVLPTGEVAVRDSKNRQAGTHFFSRGAWKSFVEAIKTTRPGTGRRL